MTDRGDIADIEDLYVDVLVGPPTTPYRLLDLDELAAAVTAGTVAADVAMRGLQQCQVFLDRRLNRRHDVTPTWPNFPPSELEPSRWRALPSEWHRQQRPGSDS